MNRYTKTLAILGLGLMTSISAFAGGPDGHKRGEWIDKEVLSQLPQDKQDLVLNALKQAKEENKALKDEITATRDNMKTILTAAEFDAEAFKAEAAKMEALMSQKFTSFTDAIVEVAPQLTQDERKILADAVPNKHKWHKKSDKDQTPETETQAPQAQ